MNIKIQCEHWNLMTWYNNRTLLLQIDASKILFKDIISRSDNREIITLTKYASQFQPNNAIFIDEMSVLSELENQTFFFNQASS